MQITSNPKVSNNDLNAALASLRNAASKWDQAESNMRQVDRYVSSADSEFRNADFPARRASFDNANTDSSWEGRQLDRHFRTGDRHLDNSQWDLRSAKREADGMGRDIDSGQSFLSSLESEYRRNNDPRLSQVQQAIAETNSSESQFGRVQNDWRRVDSSLSFTSSAVDRSNFDIQQIMWDRPGQDVSHYGFRVSSNLNSIQSDLRQIDSNLRSAASSGDQGEGHLDNAIRILEGLQSGS